MSQSTTTMTTTAFNIDLIDPAIGMKPFTNQSNTPTTIKTIITWSKGMIHIPLLRPAAATLNFAAGF
jgi:hypothetical protein